MKTFVHSLCVLAIAAIIGNTTSAFAQDKAALIAKGEKVYKAYCQTCHQATGQGLSTVYPPLAGSDYIKGKPKKDIISSVVNGLKGEITVNGKKFRCLKTTPMKMRLQPLPTYTTRGAIRAVSFQLPKSKLLARNNGSK